MKFIEKLRLAYLYPEHLNLYGDRGNIICLKKRAELRGIDLEVDGIGIGDRLDYQNYDLIFMGGGQDYDQSLIYNDFMSKKSEMEAACLTGVVGLFICGGYQLTGHYYLSRDGQKLDGLGIFDIITLGKKQRLVGDLLTRIDRRLTLENFKEAPAKSFRYRPANEPDEEFDGIVRADDPQILIGFENHSGHTFIKKHPGELKPLGTVLYGNGNNGNDEYEGVILNNFFGTYIHGSILPLNPAFADYLLLKALEHRSEGRCRQLPGKAIDDSGALLVRRKVMNRHRVSMGLEHGKRDSD